MTGSSPLAFLLGHQMAQVRSPCLVDGGDPAQNCETRPPDAANGHVVTFIEPASWQVLGSVLDIES